MIHATNGMNKGIITSEKASLRDCILFDFIYYLPNDLTIEVEMKEMEMEKTEMKVEGDGCDIIKELYKNF